MNDAHRLGPLNRRAGRFNPTLGERGIGDIALDGTDGDRIEALLDHAVALAESVVGADATADLGKGVGRLGDLVGLSEATFGGQFQPVGYVVL